MTASLNKKSFDELAEDEFHGFQIKFMLGNSKAPVYLINTPSTNQTYALKLFRYNGDSINPHYVNEARFCFLQHQNIIKYVKTEPVKHQRKKFLELVHYHGTCSQRILCYSNS